MAAPKKGRSRQHPGRPLAVILVAIVALVGGMFLSGTKTPRLGIDLAGGTSITLTAKNEPGQKNAINKANMNTAVNIIERRVNGVGVTQAQVQTQGSSHIIVNIPKGTNEKQAREQVGKTARLYFRPVIQVSAATSATPSPPPSSSSTKKSSPSSPASPGSSSSSKASSSSTASPSSSSTTQGRAVSDALKKGASGALEKNAAKSSKAPKAGSTSAPKPSPTSTSGLDESVPTALQKQYDSLKCNGKSKPALGKTDQKVVACGSSDGDAKGNKFILGPSGVSGTDLSKASATLDQQSGGWQVNLEFNGKGSSDFQKITSELSKQSSPQNQFAIVLDGDVISAPQVTSTIGGGQAQITGSFSQTEAKDLANVLSYGALPLTFRTDDVTEVSAALGSDQLHGGLIAGAIGLFLVVLYSLLYYRGLALVSVCSLAVSAVLSYSIMTLLGPGIGFALNLPAVCGAIVAIGITADSFIVYFERIRDQIREGSSLRPAVERAWPLARRTILVSDFVSFLAAAVLYIVSVSDVQGFAFTLGLTTLIDIVVVFLFTKPMMTALARTRFYGGGHRWSGLDPKRLGARPAPIRGRRRRPATPLKES